MIYNIERNCFIIRSEFIQYQFTSTQCRSVLVSVCIVVVNWWSSYMPE